MAKASGIKPFPDWKIERISRSKDRGNGQWSERGRKREGWEVREYKEEAEGRRKGTKGRVTQSGTTWHRGLMTLWPSFVDTEEKNAPSYVTLGSTQARLGKADRPVRPVKNILMKGSRRRRLRAINWDTLDKSRFEKNEPRELLGREKIKVD